jgi:hypothetical protein
MPVSRAASLLFVVLLFGSACSAQGRDSGKLILIVDGTVDGPLGGQKSSSCLRIFSDGTVNYASWGNSAPSLVDKETGLETRPEHTVSVQHHLDKGGIWELSSFLESSVIRGLPEKFGPPHRPIDYFEQISIQIMEPQGSPKLISTREFYVASLEEETHYPSALIVLMHKIDEIEREANSKGTPAAVPPSCKLKPAQD